MLREGGRVLRGLVYGVAQDVVPVLGGGGGHAVAQLGPLLAEQRLPAEVAAPLRVRVRDLHLRLFFIYLLSQINMILFQKSNV